MRQKEVFWATFPYSDMEGEKHRPALILSNDVYNRGSDDVLICAITSSQKAWPHSIALDAAGFREGSLPVKSRLRCDKIVSVHKTLLERKICSVNGETFAKAVKEINKLLRPPD